jgi:hypothetical protein
MNFTSRTVVMSIGAVILGAALVTSVSGYPGVMSGYGTGIVKERIHFRGQVVCAGCTLEDMRTTPPASRALLYELIHQQERVVMEVTPESASLPARRLWLRSGAQVWPVLTAEENFFKEIEVSGLLREPLPTLAILDLPDVHLVGEQ